MVSAQNRTPLNPSCPCSLAGLVNPFSVQMKRSLCLFTTSCCEGCKDFCYSNVFMLRRTQVVGPDNTCDACNLLICQQSRTPAITQQAQVLAARIAAITQKARLGYECRHARSIGPSLGYERRLCMFDCTAGRPIR